MPIRETLSNPQCLLDSTFLMFIAKSHIDVISYLLSGWLIWSDWHQMFIPNLILSGRQPHISFYLVGLSHFDGHQVGSISMSTTIEHRSPRSCHRIGSLWFLWQKPIGMSQTNLFGHPTKTISTTVLLIYTHEVHRPTISHREQSHWCRIFTLIGLTRVIRMVPHISIWFEQVLSMKTLVCSPYQVDKTFSCWCTSCSSLSGCLTQSACLFYFILMAQGHVDLLDDIHTSGWLHPM